MDLPAESNLRWILDRTALLLTFGAEPVGGLVTPTPAFFPDTFDGSPASVARLLSRVQTHAGLSKIPSAVTIVSPEGEEQTASCSSGACGGSGKIEARLDRVARHEDGSYEVKVGAGEVRQPVLLTTGLVRATACMFLTEAGAYDEIEPEDREPATDLAAILLGFGVLIANGSYVYMKGCGGVNVHSATRMAVGEVAVALATYCRLHDVSEGTAAKHLDVTQRAHFDEAAAWAASNASVIRMLRSDREAIQKDLYSLSPSRSWLARVLGIGSKKSVRASDEDLAALEQSLAASSKTAKPRNAAKDKRMAELRALVDESLEN
jgi:hypothetical protein